MNLELNKYEINKQLMLNEPLQDPIIVNRRIADMEKMVFEKKYWMLLCRERNDYTVFVVKDNYNGEQFKKDIKECLTNRGDIIDISLEDKNCYEIWLKIENEAFAYYFFNYEDGIIEV